MSLEEKCEFCGKKISKSSLLPSCCDEKQKQEESIEFKRQYTKDRELDYLKNELEHARFNGFLSSETVKRILENEEKIKKVAEYCDQLKREHTQHIAESFAACIGVKLNYGD